MVFEERSHISSESSERRDLQFPAETRRSPDAASKLKAISYQRSAVMSNLRQRKDATENFQTEIWAGCIM
jgi:hypothetical protein